MPVELLLLVVVVAAAGLAVGLLVFRRGRSSVEATSLQTGLARTRTSLRDRLRAVFERESDERFEDLEDALISADIGVHLSGQVTDRVKQNNPTGPEETRIAVRRELLSCLEGRDRSLKLLGKPAVIVVVGVNGTGKTTTVAKLGHYLRQHGYQPLLAAADTFRAAADQQLRMWADRLDIQVVASSPRSDPASVAFDALQAARARERDVVIVDTAGRLHSHQNLMHELAKIVRVLGRETDHGVDEVLLVMDATVGQNGLAQAREFTGAVDVSGIVLTKLDGTARGGIVIAAEQEYDIPVKFVGVGERASDLIPFDSEDFVDAILEGT
ncbi:MAG: signal recognition particle-docking protein FtsY [Acidimicrobiia bacterium]